MDIMQRIAQWEAGDGADTFRAMGIGEGWQVLDFGFGAGHFSVAAANAVGSSGRVVALDSDLASVEGLRNRISTENRTNIDVVHADGGARIDHVDNSVDCILFYDILHFEELNRLELIAQAHRVLRPGGILSILPFHMSEEAVIRLVGEITAAGFEPSSELPEVGPHFGMLYKVYKADAGADFDSVAKGTITNFRKA